MKQYIMILLLCFGTHAGLTAMVAPEVFSAGLLSQDAQVKEAPKPSDHQDCGCGSS